MLLIEVEVDADCLDTRDLAAIRHLVQRLRAEARRRVDLIYEEATRPQAGTQPTCWSCSKAGRASGCCLTACHGCCVSCAFKPMT